MKKGIAVCLLIVLAAAFAGCGGTAEQIPQAPEPTSFASDAAPVSTAEPAPESAAETESAEPSEAEQTAPEGEGEAKAVVVFFSATGNTRRVAEKIAELTGADLCEIVPAQPYTAEDLNYGDSTSRSTVEQNTPSARPEIAGEISLDGYTTVYLGYPIWWRDAPRILCSFVESHDFTGVTVIPFCTSASSGAGRTGETLGELAGTGTFLPATRFGANVSDSGLQSWVDGLEP